MRPGWRGGPAAAEDAGGGSGHPAATNFRAERSLLITLLPRHELWDILDETPTPAAVTIVRELPPEHAAELRDDMDSHTVADILQELPDERAAAIAEELRRPQDVAPQDVAPQDVASMAGNLLLRRLAQASPLS